MMLASRGVGQSLAVSSRLNRVPVLQQLSYQLEPCFALSSDQRGQKKHQLSKGKRSMSAAVADAEEGAGDEGIAHDPRLKILSASLSHVNRHGWSKEALAAGANDVGMPPVAHGLFKRGAAELAEYWMQLGNDDLRDFLEQGTAANDEFGNSVEGLEGGTERPFPSGEQLVAAALFRRLQHTIPHLRSWPQAMALGLYPENLTTTVQRLHEIPEIICNAADASEGKSGEWAERAGAVGAVYASSELYMLTDYSEGYVDTRRFVENRLRDSLNLEDKVPVDAFKAVFSGVGSLVTAAATMVSPLVPHPPDSMPNPLASVKDTFGNHPPDPQQVLSQMQQHAAQAGQTVQGIANSANPAQAAFGEAKKAADFIHQQATGAAAAAAGGGNASASPTEAPARQAATASAATQPPQPSSNGGLDPFDVVDLDGSEAVLETVKLPAGLSLFGLLSMNVEEARAIVEAANPDFTVLVTNNSDENMQPLHNPRVVRLMVDDDNIVVDTLRS